ncbi:MAG: hypothetical protein HYX53_13465 [Chloroflexi bacterium]|nr:hypothetical protein [Chloroflexota bacterium]
MTATIDPKATPTATPAPATEFRVAFINLLSPLTVDKANQVAAETFDERLDIVIKELKEFNPDLVGFNAASWTKERGSAAAKLARELKMEINYARANPWFPGASKEESDALAKQVGFEEGELFLSRYPVIRAERYELNPRTSESGEGRAALHMVVKGPGATGEIDVYITHLTGGGDKTRAAQTADFVAWVMNTRGKGPTIVMAGQSDQTAASTYDFYKSVGLKDVAEEAGTCCRESVVGEQPPLTVHSDYLMYDRWAPKSFRLFGDQPMKRADGTLLYGSDHNGVAAVFPIEPMAIPP